MVIDRPLYSRAERISDAVVHVSGLTIALMGLPVLIVLAALLGRNAATVVGVTVYAVSMVGMIFASALYNMVPSARWSRTLRSLDHSAIYAKIAGTYTPFTLMSGHGFYLLAGLWGAALTGAGLRILSPDRMRWVGLAIYLGMGWAGAVAGGMVFATVSTSVFVLIVVGGSLYTVGVGFFLMSGMRYHYTIWHVMVLAATGVFYAAVLTHLVQTA